MGDVATREIGLTWGIAYPPGFIMNNSFFRKTLLVEDLGLIRHALKSLLIQSDPRLEIDEADSYESAMRLLELEDYDLVFLDINLGGSFSGLDLLRWISENDIGVQTVMLSEQDNKETVFECIKAGASGFISKATDGEDDIFKVALETILNGQIYLPSTVLGRGGYSPRPTGAVRSDAIDLSPRLAETLRFICKGLSNKAIAKQMCLTENTVKDYVSDLLEKFGVKRRTELIVEMARRGVIIPQN
jgi:two-component system nitrate/nitrite response regulator NarL